MSQPVAKDNPNAATFKHVREVQIFISRELASDANVLLGKLVTASGVLNEAVAPSQYTDVWMDVKAITAVP
jgi:hypothetical protein